MNKLIKRGTLLFVALFVSVCAWSATSLDEELAVCKYYDGSSWLGFVESIENLESPVFNEQHVATLIKSGAQPTDHQFMCVAVLASINNAAALRTLNSFVKTAGMNVDTTDGDGRTALVLGIEYENVALVEWALKNHANINHKVGDTPAIFFVRNSSQKGLDIVKELVNPEYGPIDFQAVNYMGITIIHRTVDAGWIGEYSPAILKEWKAAGAQDKPNRQGETALNMAEKFIEDNKEYKEGVRYEAAVKCRDILRATPENGSRELLRAVFNNLNSAMKY